MLRGLAVAGVVCNHLGAYLQVPVPWIGRLGGLLGVELFFVISGYLIARSCAALPLGPYLVRRAFRIFPVDRFAAGAMVAAAALPVAGNVYMLAQHFGVAPRRVSAAILVSTAASLLTVTAVVALVGTG